MFFLSAGLVYFSSIVNCRKLLPISSTTEAVQRVVCTVHAEQRAEGGILRELGWRNLRNIFKSFVIIREH